MIDLYEKDLDAGNPIHLTYRDADYENQRQSTTTATSY